MIRSLALPLLASFPLVFLASPTPQVLGPFQRVESSSQVINGSLTVSNDQGTALFLESTPPAGTEALAMCADASITDFNAPLVDVTGLRVRADGATFSGDVNVTGLDLIASGFAPANFTTVFGGSFLALGAECDTAIGVDGLGDADTLGIPCGIGVRGRTNGNSAFSMAVFSMGNFAATGTKAFLQPHPEDPAQVVRFVALEGNESGTYFRGTGRLEGGEAEIVVPDSWRFASEEEGITVQLTPIGANLGLYVAEQSRERIVVRGERDGSFHYLVNGVRRGFAEHEDLVENRFFVPTVRGVPFGREYPPALRQILIDNGILQADGTPDEETARRLGWKLVDPENVPLAERWWLRRAERVAATGRTQR